MDIFNGLKDTPVPTLMLIGGFVFLFLGIATIKKPIVIDVTPSSRKIALVLGIILVGIGLYLILSQPTSPSGIATEMPAAGIIATPSVATNAGTITETPAVSVVYLSPDITHLGDEKVPGWEKLTDACLTAKVQIVLPVHEVILSLKTFGLTERAIIKVNDSEISVIPPLGESNQDVWSDLRSFPLTTSYFVNGFNIVEICAVPLTKNASHPGELDDFQIRNVQVSTK